MDCPEFFNSLMAMNFPEFCGERVIYTPYEYACCGLCPSHATDCSNLCGLYGIKTGEPQVFLPFLTGIRPGTAGELVAKLHEARHAWAVRTNKGGHGETELTQLTKL
jgi:hypothetical protein